MALASAEPFRPPVVDSLSVRVVIDCSGRAFLAGMATEIPEKLVLSNTGSRFTFGA